MSHWTREEYLQHQLKTGTCNLTESDFKKSGKEKAPLAQSVSNVCKINIKPISVNQSYRGRRFSTPEHKKWKQAVMLLLPNFILPGENLKIHYEFGFSSKASDLDNAIKAVQDCLAEKYHFNDREVFELSAKKVIVNKNEEYFLFHIQPI